MSWRLTDDAHIGADMAGRVLDALADDDDPLLLGQWDDHAEGARVESVVVDALRGASRDVADRVARSLRQRRVTALPGLDMTTARIMASVGVDPLILGWLAVLDGDEGEVFGSTSYARIDGRRPTDTHDCMTGVGIGDGIHWYANGLVITKGLPDTVLAAATGRPLADVVSHPLIDPLGLTITSTEDGIIETDQQRGQHGGGDATVKALAALTMVGRR